MKRHWMPFYFSDYLADTSHLSTVEHGAYLLLIAHYWAHDGLPADEAIIARITRMTARQWSQSRDRLRSLFGDMWRHKRIDKEIAKAIEKSKVNSSNAHRRHSGRTAVAQRSDTQLQPQLQKKDIEAKKIGTGKPKKQAELPLPTDWKPNIESVQKAQALGFTPREIGLEVEKFKHHAVEKQRLFARPNAAFDRWMLNAATYQNKAPPETKSTGGFSALPGSPEFQAWRTYFRDGGKAALVRQLEQRELEGRAFNFESQWPPGHKSEAA